MIFHYPLIWESCQDPGKVIRGPFGRSDGIPIQWEMEFHVKYFIKESLEKCKRKPNGKKKGVET